MITFKCDVCGKTHDSDVAFGYLDKYGTTMFLPTAIEAGWKIVVCGLYKGPPLPSGRHMNIGPYEFALINTKAVCSETCAATLCKQYGKPARRMDNGPRRVCPDGPLMVRPEDLGGAS